MRLIPLITQAAVAAVLLAGCSYVAEAPGNLEAADVEPTLRASALDQNASSGPMEASVEDTYVYLEFPEFGASGDEYKRLDFTVRVRNSSDRPIEVRAEELYLSFDPNLIGRAVGALDVSTETPDRMLGGNRIVVPARDSTLVRVQGDRYFRDEEAGPVVYLTLILRSGENTVAVRDEAQMFIAR